MKRRRVITALSAIGVAGLGGHFLTGSLTDEEVQRVVSIESQDRVSKDYEVDIDVELLESRITNSHTAKLQITTTNKGPKRAISIGTNGCKLFSRNKGGSDDPPGLWLHSPEKARNIKRENNRWVLAQSEQPLRYPMYGCHPKDYNAGESLSNEYVVWHNYAIDGYLNSGTYRWEENISIYDGVYDADTEYDSITWGFSLQIENPK